MLNPDYIQALLMDYLTTRDGSFLERAVKRLGDESFNPSLQETYLVLDALTYEQCEEQVNLYGAVTIPVTEATNKRLVDGEEINDETCEIETRKLIRVYPVNAQVIPLRSSEGEHKFPLIFSVVSYDGRNIILVSPPQGEIR